MNKTKITISGDAASGKSLIMIIIKQTLPSLGIKVEVISETELLCELNHKEFLTLLDNRVKCNKEN